MVVTYNTIPCGCIIKARRTLDSNRITGPNINSVRTELKYTNICATHKTQLNDEAKTDAITRIDAIKADIQNTPVPDET